MRRFRCEHPARKHEVVKVLVEDAGLDLVGGLCGSQRLFHIENGLIGAGGEIEGVGQAHHRAANGHDGCHADKVADAHAAGAHGDDFAVGGQAAQPQQHPHQHGHGNGDAEGVGRVKRKISTTLVNVELLRTTISRM